MFLAIDPMFRDELLNKTIASKKDVINFTNKSFQIIKKKILKTNLDYDIFFLKFMALITI